MGSMQRRKGVVFEQEFATILRERFGDDSKDRGVRRGIQSRGGGKEAADVTCDALSWMHFECMHGKKPNIRAKLMQAEEDARAGRVPVAVVKFDREEPIVAMRLSRWLFVVEAAVANAGGVR
jgi:hypothetical protein